MNKKHEVLGFQAVVFPEEGGYSAIAPEINVASQGDTMEEALDNLREALELRLEALSTKEISEIKSKLGKKAMATQLNIEISA